jgi:hypothetical protein
MTRSAPVDVMNDPALLAPFFSGVTWARWRAVLRAVDGLPLSAKEAALFGAVAGGRAPPTAPVREFVVVAGRRSGKDSIASAIATRAAISDHGARLRPGERATIFCIACDRAQAQVVLRYIKGYFANVPLLSAMVGRELADGLELSNNVEIIVGTNDYRALRGRTLVCVVMDEAAFYAGGDATSSDREVYNAVIPSLATVPGSLLVIISSPWRRSGLLYDKWARHFGKDDPDILVVHGPTRAFNELVEPRIIDDAFARDPGVARAEWYAEWRDDLATFIGRELLEAAVDPGVVVRPPRANTIYCAFCDPSGGAHDSFTAAIAHRDDGDTAVLDLLYERRAPFDPSVVVAEIAELLRGYRVAEITGDRYAARWVIEAFAKEGISYLQSELDRSAIYLDSLPLFTSGRVRLIDSPRLVTQLAALERRTFSTGRDRVDHGPRGADDAANSVAGALVRISGAPDSMQVWSRLGELPPLDPRCVWMSW